MQIKVQRSWLKKYSFGAFAENVQAKPLELDITLMQGERNGRLWVHSFDQEICVYVRTTLCTAPK